MPASRLSKSSSSATAQWEPGYRVAWRYADDRFALADWSCDGMSAGPPPAADEFTRHFEINLHRRGWHVRSVARRRYFIDPLHPSVWPAGSGFRLSHNTAHPQAATLLFVTQALIDEALEGIEGGAGTALRSLRSSPAHWRSGDLIAYHARLLAARPDDRLAVEERSLALIRRVIAEAAGASDALQSPSARRAAAVDTARSFILSCYREQLSLSRIAAACGLAPSTLCACFPQIVGVPVWRYVQRLRLQDAALALAEGAEDLSALALDLGFSSHSHFAQAFGAQFGIPPSRFRWTLHGELRPRSGRLDAQRRNCSLVPA